MYQPLTEQQYNGALKAGFTHDQIVSMEQQRKSSIQNSVAGKVNTAAGGLTDAIGNNIKQAGQSLSTEFGGGKDNIAYKLGADVQSGADDIKKGGFINTVKGVAKAGLRTAGDFAGAVFALPGAAVQATGFNKGAEYLANKAVNGGAGAFNGGGADLITNNQSFQNFATSHPNAGEDFGRILNLAFAKGEKGNIDPSTVVDRTATQISDAANAAKTTASNVGKDITNTTSAIADAAKSKLPDIATKSIDELRADKVQQGYQDQISKLKSADRSHNSNTKTYTNADGTKTTVTPVDTFKKYNIAPTVENGSINMGSYEQGTGALGKVKEEIGKLDDQIDQHLTDSGHGVSVDEFKQKALDQVQKDASLRQQGKVASTQAKINGIFDDFKNSYGDTLNETEVNGIRKAMNQNFHPDTVDASRVVGDAARDIVYNVGDKQARALLRQQGELLAAKKFGQVIHGTKVEGGKLGRMALRTTGAIVGSSLHSLPVIGPLIGALGGDAVARGLQQTQFKSPLVEGRALLEKGGDYLKKTVV